MILFLMLTALIDMQDKPKLIYVGDPMCSWCYGISEELSNLKEQYEEKLAFELILGGLRPYNTETIFELKDFLSHHWKDVSIASGMAFNYEILDRKDLMYDTEPPSRATVVVRQLDPSKEFTFFKEIQKMFYVDNKDMSSADSYHLILKQLNLDHREFDVLFHSDKMKKQVSLDFQRSADMGVRGFPTILLSHKGKMHMIASGYATQAAMSDRIESLIY